PFGVVADDGRAAQPFQNADLDFLWTKRNETVETSGETFQRFARQPDNQIGVNMNASFGAKKTQVVGELLVVLPTLDPQADFGVERLDAHLELQHTGRESADEVAQRFRQPVGNHFEVDEQAGPRAFEKKLRNGLAGVEDYVEG